MRPPLRTWIAAPVAAALLAACQPGPPAGRGDDAGARRYGQVAFRPCTLGGEHGLPPVEAYCGTVRVAEDAARPGGRRIGLHIAWLPAANRHGGTSDPVFFLAGGPGQAASALATQIDFGLREVRRQRDLVLVDQRGTGRSNPLDCRDARGRPLAFDAATHGNEAGLSRYVAQCLASLAGRADPRFYTTSAAVRDLEAVRTALGVAQINLVGVSYGTRVAQQYARRHPRQVRSLVLDGVAPNRLVLGGEFARHLDAALRRQDALCARMPACRARFGTDLLARLHRLKARLQAAPVEVGYRDPAGHGPRRGTLTGDTLTGLVQGVSYLPQLSALLPLVVSEAEQGRYGSLMALAQFWQRQVGEQVNRGMQWSVVCAEDAPRHRSDPRDAGTVLGADAARRLLAACRYWPRGAVAADFTAPLTGATPTLLLSGELDPVTPPQYGEEVARHLRNVRHLVLRGQGHGALGVGCTPKLLGRFLESADPGALDATCLDSLRYVPPFTSFNGWEP